MGVASNGCSPLTIDTLVSMPLTNYRFVYLKETSYVEHQIIHTAAGPVAQLHVLLVLLAIYFAVKWGHAAHLLALWNYHHSD